MREQIRSQIIAIPAGAAIAGALWMVGSVSPLVAMLALGTGLAAFAALAVARSQPRRDRVAIPVRSDETRRPRRR